MYYHGTTGWSDIYLNINSCGAINTKENLVYIGEFDSGIEWDNGILRTSISRTTISKSSAEEINTVLKEILKEDIREISVAQLIELGKRKALDFREFQRYYYSEEKELMSELENNDEADNVVRMDITDSDCYLLIWYIDQINVVEDENGNEAEWSKEIYKAEVYNQESEFISLYDDGLASFLEDAKWRL